MRALTAKIIGMPLSDLKVIPAEIGGGFGGKTTVFIEPVALALSPTGKRLFVAELAQSRVDVIDTKTMKVTASIDVDRPRALLVTNNGDANEDDETLVVTQFYGAPVPGKEARDDGRTGDSDTEVAGRGRGEIQPVLAAAAVDGHGAD